MGPFKNLAHFVLTSTTDTFPRFPPYNTNTHAYSLTQTNTHSLTKVRALDHFESTLAAEGAHGHVRRGQLFDG